MFTAVRIGANHDSQSTVGGSPFANVNADAGRATTEATSSSHGAAPAAGGARRPLQLYVTEPAGDVLEAHARHAAVARHAAHHEQPVGERVLHEHNPVTRSHGGPWGIAPSAATRRASQAR